MKNKVILITGALTGIGRATAIAFSREGAHVVVCGRHDDAGNALVTELRAVGAEAEYIHADVRHEDDVKGLVDRTIKRFGRLDVAVNNAGTEGKPGPVTEQTAETYAAAFDTNVLGTVLSMKHELRAMQGQRHGSIINLSSTMGHKAAPGVRVNAVAPGPIETGMLNRFTGSDERKAGLIAGVPLKRAGEPEEIAKSIVFLSSDRASFITGATIAVDGGKTAL